MTKSANRWIKVRTNGSIVLEKADISQDGIYKGIGNDCSVFETVELGKDGLIMLIDEEGKLKGLPMNRRASMLYGRLPHDWIVGNALIVKTGIVDGEPDLCALNPDEAHNVIMLLLTMSIAG